jgi:hypothetical protein
MFHGYNDDLGTLDDVINGVGKIRFFCSFPVKFMRLTKQGSPGSTRNSAALRLLKVESGINGLLPTS